MRDDFSINSLLGVAVDESTDQSYVKFARFAGALTRNLT